LKDLEVQLSNGTANDNSWQKESRGNPNTIGRNRKEIPDGNEPDNLLVSSSQLIVVDSSNRTAFSVEEE